MNYTKISDASMLSIKLSFLVSWIEMITEMRVGQELKKYNKTFYHYSAGNCLEIHYFDWNNEPAIPISFNEFVGINIVFFANKNNFKIV